MITKKSKSFFSNMEKDAYVIIDDTNANTINKLNIDSVHSLVKFIAIDNSYDDYFELDIYVPKMKDIVDRGKNKDPYLINMDRLTMRFSHISVRDNFDKMQEFANKNIMDVGIIDCDHLRDDVRAVVDKGLGAFDTPLFIELLKGIVKNNRILPADKCVDFEKYVKYVMIHSTEIFVSTTKLTNEQYNLLEQLQLVSLDNCVVLKRSGLEEFNLPVDVESLSRISQVCEMVESDVSPHYVISVYNRNFEFKN